MDMIRVSKVEDVVMHRRGVRVEGNLHLMQHHIVFRYIPAPHPGSSHTKVPPKKEVWITYPIISHCILHMAPVGHPQASNIRLRCRDFTFFMFHFPDDRVARDVYESIRSLSCKLGRLDKLLAFAYQPKPPEDKFNGWEIYDARREYKRLGISPKDSEKGWRISEINKNYEFSQTYPSVLVVPTKISDNVLNYAGRFRSRQRIPVLVYRHPINNCSITRSSQPQPGLRGNRNPQDESLVAAIFDTNSGWRTLQRATAVAPCTPPRPSPEASAVDLAERDGGSYPSTVVEPEYGDSSLTSSEEQLGASTEEIERPRIYGAQQRNLIVDARPTVNAMVMQAVGQGSEKMEYYPNAEKAYLGIDNIHVMRRSLNAVIEALKDSDFMDYKPPAKALQSSGWLKHIDNILRGTDLIARRVGIMHSHVLIHCSDGWDRTSQLSALSQICLDPYYRTLEGFIVLVEKDWLSFGHMFRHRSGFLGSDKWFEIENDRVERRPDGSGGGSNAFENALRGARGLFNRQNGSNEALSRQQEPGPSEMQPISDSSPATEATFRPSPTTIGAAEEHRVTKVNELSPVFHQFLDAVYQLAYQYPTRFEFNERFLRRLLYHLYSCQYGTFLFDNEKERVQARAAQRTRSVWDYFLCRKQEFLNDRYDPVVDDSIRGKERMIFPQRGRVRWWAEVFGRADEDMNGPNTTPSLMSQVTALDDEYNGGRTPVRSGTNTPQPYSEQVVTGRESAEGASGSGTTVHPSGNILPAAAEWSQTLGSNLSKGLTAGIEKLGIQSSSRGVGSERRSSRPRSPAAQVQDEMGVEMQ